MRKYKRRPGYLDNKYRQLKAEAYRRDKGTCIFPNCKKKRILQLHHIKKYSQFPELRYSIDNVCLLCKEHHKQVTGHEEQYAPLLLNLINALPSQDVLKIKYGIEENPDKEI